MPQLDVMTFYIQGFSVFLSVFITFSFFMFIFYRLLVYHFLVDFIKKKILFR